MRVNNQSTRRGSRHFYCWVVVVVVAVCRLCVNLFAMQTHHERPRSSKASEDARVVRRSTTMSNRVASAPLRGHSHHHHQQQQRQQHPLQKQHDAHSDPEQQPKGERYMSRPRTDEELKEAEYGWKAIDTLKSIPPNDYTITHVNQDHDLLVHTHQFWYSILIDFLVIVK